MTLRGLVAALALAVAARAQEQAADVGGEDARQLLAVRDEDAARELAKLEEVCFCTAHPMEVVTGHVDASQSAGLKEMNLYGKEDQWKLYVEAETDSGHFEGNVVFDIPEYINLAKVKKYATNVNFRGEKAKGKKELWEIRTTRLGKRPKWEKLWDNKRVKAWQWTESWKQRSKKGKTFAAYVDDNNQFRFNVRTVKQNTENALFDYVDLCLYLAKGWKKPTAAPTNAPTPEPTAISTPAPTTGQTLDVPESLHTECFVPASLEVEQGWIGSEQTVEGLAKREMNEDSKNEAWNKIVEFHPETVDGKEGGVFYFDYHVGEISDPFQAYIKWNFRGQTTEYQLWKLSLYNYAADSWVCLGQTPNAAKSWRWIFREDRYIFRDASAKYVNDEGIARVRYATNSSLDASQLDFAKLCLKLPGSA
ncbi:Hypothetical Protein FCC1311_020842 [Hondaea fermentalgiana]|uniref:Glycosyl-hydrolase 114-associated domain-containing protein n=1 Tax=Hondaea fermentalgiana TaxID=2315210 RepID=A0A2R5G5P7_9STRA|nr:Hypothetical Protein FCC1311_020842 [Hondaea fermentalgiana]|eukprot:GBG25865.1 Hypothetical Protein FCC1311_020842 [Hondaea fermentalgiana]